MFFIQYTVLYPITYGVHMGCKGSCYNNRDAVNLDLKLVLRAGVVWAVIGIVIMVAVALLGAFLSAFGVEGLSVWSYAAMFAGVHFALRSGEGWVVAIIGGALAGLIAGALIVVAQLLLGSFLSLGGGGSFDPLALAGALIAGLVGGLGMKLSQKF